MLTVRDGKRGKIRKEKTKQIIQAIVERQESKSSIIYAIQFVNVDLLVIHTNELSDNNYYRSFHV